MLESREWLKMQIFQEMKTLDVATLWSWNEGKGNGILSIHVEEDNNGCFFNELSETTA